MGCKSENTFKEGCLKPTGDLVVHRIQIKQGKYSSNILLYTLVDMNGCVFYQEELLPFTKVSGKYNVGDVVNKKSKP